MYTGMDNTEDRFQVEMYSEAQRTKLRRWNLGAGILHLCQSITQLVLAFSVDNFKEFKLPLVTYFLGLKRTESGAEFLGTSNKLLGNLQLGPLVFIFFLLSAFFHFLVLVPYFNEMYWEQINRGKNYFRWIEYSISSSVMIWLISMLFGVVDITLLISIAFANATMNILGLMQEKYNNVRDANWTVDWLPFWLGCFIGIVPWIVVYSYLGSAASDTQDQIPGFVYGILVGYFIFFNTFPINMVLQYKRVGPWRDYIFGEMGYIVLSLASKTLLGWLVFGGLNQPNEYTSS
mmetsp:Transcript_6149/g.10138  ORF Transcript_6149/g.10138 Transcript_6149/m.10138 type:complete len:290 (-) Transcript_6149:87-956(-)